MRKITSIFMALIFIISALIMTIPANASMENSSATAELIDYIDALYFEKSPTIDGYISTEEWGEASFKVEATDCATADDQEQYNRFIYWRHGEIGEYYTWSYTVWMRWDENYFYVGVKVVDPDVHMLIKGTNNTWDGDAIQMRVDVAGPNAVVEGQEFSVSSTYSTPWSSKNIPDFLFGYVQLAGGFTEAWEGTSNRGMTSFSRNPLGEAKVVIAPAGSNYSSDTQNGITTYEIGIPWAYILNGEIDADGNQISSLTYTTYTAGRKGNITGGIGREFGISMVCLDDGNNVSENTITVYDAWMAWGSGICGDHQTLGAKTCTGSNSVMLSDAKISPASSYQKYDPTSLLDASYSTENVDKPGIFYDYLAGDTFRETVVKYDDLSVLTYDITPDDDRSVFGSDLHKGHVTNIGGEHKNILDYSDFLIPGEAQFYVDTRDDGITYEFPTSYTIEFDIRYIDTQIIQSDTDSRIFNFFGGPTVADYCCGYLFNENSFAIWKNMDRSEVISKRKYDLKKENWYKWRFQYDDDCCTARLWIDDLSTTADDGDGWGELIFNARWRYFNYGIVEETVLPFMFINAQVQFDNVKIYNFGSITDVSEAVEETGDHNNGGNTNSTTTVTGGGQITIDELNVYKKDNQWHVPVPVRSEYLNATELSFSFEYDATKAKLVGISGLADGTYDIYEPEAGKVGIVIKNFDEIKKMKAGDTCFEIILDATDANATVKDLNLVLSDSYKYTVATGDTMTFVIIGCVVAIAIVTSVIIIRRRKENE